MVSVGVSKLGCTHLIFVDPGVKINGCYYCEVLLNQQLLYLPYGRCLATSSCYNKSVHQRTRHARQSSCCNGRRPHSSHLIWGLRIAQISLNPVDYKIWGLMQNRVYQKKSERRERVERATGWGLGRTATERDWRCHRPVEQTPACLYSG